MNFPICNKIVFIVFLAFSSIIRVGAQERTEKFEIVCHACFTDNSIICNSMEELRLGYRINGYSMVSISYFHFGACVNPGGVFSYSLHRRHEWFEIVPSIGIGAISGVSGNKSIMPMVDLSVELRAYIGRSGKVFYGLCSKGLSSANETKLYNGFCVGFVI
jgi:hypothetical protein